MTEPLDRNKSALTHVATSTAAAWLDGLGCKPVETEVPLGDGWVADLAAFWCPTFTEAKRSRLLRALPVPDGVASMSREHFTRWCRRYGGRITVAIEVKVSRSDFTADIGRKYGRWDVPARLSPVAHALVVAAPRGVVGDNEIDCGLLELSTDCSSVLRWRGPWKLNALHPGEVEDFIAAVAVRRDHATRYAALRRWQKMRRAMGDK